MKLGQKGGFKTHQSRSWPNCRRSTADIDFSQVPAWFRNFRLWCKYLYELLEPTKVDLQLLKFGKLGHEGGWIFHQWCFRPICRRYLEDIDLRKIRDWSRDFRVWCKYLYKLLEPTRVDLQKFSHETRTGEGVLNPPITVLIKL